MLLRIFKANLARYGMEEKYLDFKYLVLSLVVSRNNIPSIVFTLWHSVTPHFAFG